MAALGRATVRAMKGGKRMIPSRAALVLGKQQAFQSGVLVTTQSAVSKIKTLLENEPGALGLRVGVKTRGCNGLTYTLDYAKEKAKFDEEVKQDGVKVFIDSKAQLTLLGTEMDYVESTLSSEFVFNNPNIKGTCGCGESFNM